MRRLVVHWGGERREHLAFRLLGGPLERLRGLLATGSDAQPVALARCASIHTWGMTYRIDVAFVARDGLVLRSYVSVPPRRVLAERHARVVLERPHERGPWPAAGQIVTMEVTKGARNAT